MHHKKKKLANDLILRVNLFARPERISLGKKTITNLAEKLPNCQKKKEIDYLRVEYLFPIALSNKSWSQSLSLKEDCHCIISFL